MKLLNYTLLRALACIVVMVLVSDALPGMRSNILVLAQTRSVLMQDQVGIASVDSHFSVSVLELTGIAYLKNRRPDLAKEYLSLATASRPLRVTTYAFLGDAYFALGNDESALETWNRANAKQVLKWRRISAAKSGDWEAVLRYLTLATRVAPRDAEIYSLLGDVYMRFDRRGEASVAYSEASRLHSDPYESALLKGKAAFVMLDFESALLSYQNAQQIAPGQAEPYYQEGVILYWGYGKLEDGVRFLEQAITIEPGDLRPYLRLTQLYDESRNFERSDYWFMKVKAIAPDDPAVQYQPIFSFVSRGDYEKALPLIEKMLIKNPKDDSLWDLKGNVLINVGRPQEASIAYRTAIALADYGVYRIHLAQEELSRGQYCAALKEAELAEHLNPTVRFVTSSVAAIRAAASVRCQ